MSVAQNSVKHVLIVAAVSTGLFFGSLFVTPYAHWLSIELVLRGIIDLGRFQDILGQVFTAVPLGIISVLVFFLLRLRPVVLYTIVSSVAASAVSFILVPAWPSNNLVRILSALAFVATVATIAGIGTRALARRSNRRATHAV